MMEKKDQIRHKNKGVSTKPNDNITSANDSTPATPCCKSLQRVKEEVKTVIELMGPNTPHLNHNSSSNMADNEESFYSNTTDFQQKTEDNQTTENDTDRTVPPDVTLQEDTDYSHIAARNSSARELPTIETIPCPQVICPPPWLPSNVLFSSECVCPQIATYMQTNRPNCNLNREVGQSRRVEKGRNVLSTLFKTFRVKSENNSIPKKCEYYTMNIKHSNSTQGIPKRLVFDLVDDVPGICEECYCQPGSNVQKICSIETCEKLGSKQFKNFNNEQMRRDDIGAFPPEQKRISKEMCQKFSQSDTEKVTRVDVYYFDHGNADYLHTTDRPPKIRTEAVAEKTEAYTTKFWAEIFGTFHIGLSFCTSFILQLLRFLLYSLMRPLTIGLIQLISDYFFKPCLTTTFNGIIQPPLTFLFNVGMSLKSLCEPIAKGFGYFMKEISIIIGAFRIVEVSQVKCCSDKNYNGKVNKKSEIV